MKEEDKKNLEEIRNASIRPLAGNSQAAIAFALYLGLAQIADAIKEDKNA